jgi:hypothetical protein
VAFLKFTPSILLMLYGFEKTDSKADSTLVSAIANLEDFDLSVFTQGTLKFNQSQKLAISAIAVAY